MFFKQRLLHWQPRERLLLSPRLLRKPATSWERLISSKQNLQQLPQKMKQMSIYKRKWLRKQVLDCEFSFSSLPLPLFSSLSIWPHVFSLLVSLSWRSLCFLSSLSSAEIQYQKQLDALAVARRQQLASIEATKFERIVSAIGKKTIQAIAKAGPEIQARLLKALVRIIRNSLCHYFLNFLGSLFILLLSYFFHHRVWKDIWWQMDPGERSLILTLMFFLIFFSARFFCVLSPINLFQTAQGLIGAPTMSTA